MAVRWIAFHVTDRCQLDCQHCLRDPAQKPEDLSLALIERVLDDAQRLYKTLHVSLTGGEPTLHPEFEGIVDAIVRRGCTWHLVTNGKRAPSLVQFILGCANRRKQLDCINLSLDGVDEATHDRIRGAGSYREVMQAATLCVSSGIPFLFNVTLNAVNAHQIEAIGLMSVQLGAARIQFGMMQATGTMHDETLRMKARQWADVVTRIKRLQASLTLEILVAEGFPKEQLFHVCEAFRSEPLHVDLKGNLNLCCMHAGIPGTRGDVGGNLHAMPLMDAHGKLLDVIHEAQKDRLAYLAKGETDAWDYFPCNSCLKQFGKPHWDDKGAVGPAAARERWTGAWSADKQSTRNDGAVAPKRLPLLR